MPSGQDHNARPRRAAAHSTFPAPAELPLVCGVRIAFGTPRKLPKPERLPGRVAVLDIAFASESGGRSKGFERTTMRFIERLGERLVAWVDHHDSDNHRLFVDDARFTLASKAQHGACPEMITPALVDAAGRVDTIVCHNDFDGLASAAKWIRGGIEPYPGCDDDARAIDTRIGELTAVGVRFDRALRARPRDPFLRTTIIDLLAHALDSEDDMLLIDEAAAELLPREQQAERLAQRFRALSGELHAVQVTEQDEPYDRTLLLLLGQRRATMALVVDGDTATFAAPFDSGVSFVERFGLSGGMPTCVSIHRAKLPEALAALGVSEDDARGFLKAPAEE